VGSTAESGEMLTVSIKSPGLAGEHLLLGLEAFLHDTQSAFASAGRRLGLRLHLKSKNGIK
jgi:hypothetical protein